MLSCFAFRQIAEEDGRVDALRLHIRHTSPSVTVRRSSNVCFMVRGSFTILPEADCMQSRRDGDRGNYD